MHSIPRVVADSGGMAVAAFPAVMLVLFSGPATVDANGTGGTDMTDTGYARPHLLVETDELAAMLGDPALRVIDCTVFLRPLPDRSNYRAESGRAQYDEGHIPGAVFADLDRKSVV